MPRSSPIEKKLKPADGRTVPMEDGRAWPEGGATVPVTLYIRRRIADGDLVEVGAKSPAVTSNAGAEATGKNGGK